MFFFEKQVLWSQFKFVELENEEGKYKTVWTSWKELSISWAKMRKKPVVFKQSKYCIHSWILKLANASAEEQTITNKFVFISKVPLSKFPCEKMLKKARKWFLKAQTLKSKGHDKSLKIKTKTWLYDQQFKNAKPWLFIVNINM